MLRTLQKEVIHRLQVCSHLSVKVLEEEVEDVFPLELYAEVQQVPVIVVGFHQTHPSIHQVLQHLEIVHPDAVGEGIIVVEPVDELGKQLVADAGQLLHIQHQLSACA